MTLTFTFNFFEIFLFILYFHVRNIPNFNKFPFFPPLSPLPPFILFSFKEGSLTIWSCKLRHSLYIINQNYYLSVFSVNWISMQDDYFLNVGIYYVCYISKCTWTSTIIGDCAIDLCFIHYLLDKVIVLGVARWNPYCS